MTAQRAWTDYFIYIDLLADAFNLGGSQCAQREIALYEPPALFCDDNAAGRRDGLHSCGKIGHMPDRRIFRVAAGVDRPQHDLASVDPDSNLHSRSLQPVLRAAAKPLAMLSQLLLDRERGVKRTLGMVLMGNRRTEHSENTVAGGLRDIAIVPVNRMHHKLQYRVDNRARLLRIELSH